MLTHLFFPVRKFGLGPGQIQTLVVWPSTRTKTEKQKQKKKKEEQRRNKKKRAQLENINPHKPTSEASICKMGFPKKNTLRFVYKAKKNMFSYEFDEKSFFCWTVDIERIHIHIFLA